MAPFQTWPSPSPSPSPQYNSKNHGAAGAGGKRLRLSTNHQIRPASFHRRSTNAAASADPHQTKQQIRRPKTQPDLNAAAGGRSRNITMSSSPPPGDLLMRKVPAKVLVNVNVQRTLGALQVMASTDWTVHQFLAAALNQYVKEGRRPLLPSTDPSAFGLHYSQFSFECLDHKEKLIGLGSRNFFLCPKTTTAVSASILPPTAAGSGSGSGSGPASSSSSSSCSNEADKASKITLPWFRFMDFLFYTNYS